MTKKLRVDIWSDVACPWCWIGKRRFEAALARFAGKEEVELVWRAFELDPSKPDPEAAKVPFLEVLAKKFGSSVKAVEEKLAHVTATGKEEGLELRFDRVQRSNTFDAHRVVHLGLARGIQDAVKERLFQAHLSEGASMSDPETLVRLGAEAGLDAEEVRALLASDQETRAVRTDEREAQEIGIRGVPFFVIGGRYAVSGAQPAEVLLGALEKAYSELAPPALYAEGAACTPDGC